MKYLIVLLLSTLALSSFLPRQNTKLGLPLPTPQNLMDFLVGNLVSLQVLEQIPDGFPCVNTLTTLRNNTLQAVALFNQGHFLDAIHLLESTFTQTFSSCTAANSEALGAFKNFLDIVRAPDFAKLVVYRIANNQAELIDDFAGGVEKLNNQSFFDAGVLWGKMVHTLLSGPVNMTSSLELLALPTNSSCPFMQFLQGYLEAIKVFDAVPDGLSCLNDIVNLKETMLQILNLLANGKILEAIQLAEDTMNKDLATCQNALKDGTTLFQSFVQEITADGFFDLARGRVRDNFFTIIEDVEKAVRDFTVLEFYQAGKDFGHIPHLILSGPDA
jgi:hypothetical protein